jgi:hypothetical protein
MALGAGGPFAWMLNSLGLRGAQNIAAWVVAGGTAYFLWVLPQQQDAARRKVRTSLKLELSVKVSHFTSS